MRMDSTFSAERVGALLFPAALAVLGMVLVLAREIRYGPALFPDSLEYLSAAQNFADGKGLVNVKGAPMTTWPPLYSLLLAAAGWAAGLDLLDVVAPLHAALFGLAVFAAGRHLRRRLESRFLAAWGCAAMVLSPPLTDAASRAVSGSLFVPLAIFALIEAEEFLRTGKRRRLLAAAAWSSAAWLMRYIGVAAPFWIGLSALLRKGVPLRRKAREGAAFALAAGLLPALWMLRNYLLEGEFSGDRAIYDVSLRSVLRGVGGVLWSWTDCELPGGVGVGAGAVLAAACWGALRPRAALGGGGAGGGFAAGRSVAVWGGFALAYGVLFVAAAWAGYSNPDVRPRYVMPLYAPLLFAGAFALDGLLLRVRPAAAGQGGRSPAAGRAAAALIAASAAAGALWTAGLAASNVRHIEQRNTGRSASGMLDWFNSATLRYVRENPLEGVVYSSRFSPAALVLLRNQGAAAYRMHTTSEHNAALGLVAQSSNPAAAQQEFESRLQDAPEGAWVVLFEAGKSELIGCGDAWLRASPTLQSVAQFPDGCIARVGPRFARRSRVGGLGRALRGGRGSAGHGSRVGGGFDVFWRGGELVYVKEGCTAEDARTRFFLHVWPQDEADLPAGRRPHGMDNLDFQFREYGVVLDGACMALRPLPDYAAARIRTGQYTPERGALWQTEPRLRRGRD